MMMNYCICFIEYIFLLCWGGGARFRKESAAANQQPLSSSLREQVCVYVVNDAGRDQSSTCNSIRLPNIAVSVDFFNKSILT